MIILTAEDNQESKEDGMQLEQDSSKRFTGAFQKTSKLLQSEYQYDSSTSTFKTYRREDLFKITSDRESYRTHHTAHNSEVRDLKF